MANRYPESVCTTLQTCDEESACENYQFAHPENHEMERVVNKNTRVVEKDDFELFYGMDLSTDNTLQGERMVISRNRRMSSGSIFEKPNPSPLSRRFSCHLGQPFTEDHDVLTSASKDQRLLEILHGLTQKNVVDVKSC
eukprot:753717-Hanusia_phi.AAC.1